MAESAQLIFESVVNYFANELGHVGISPDQRHTTEQYLSRNDAKVFGYILYSVNANPLLSALLSDAMIGHQMHCRLPSVANSKVHQAMLWFSSRQVRYKVRKFLVQTYFNRDFGGRQGS